MKLKEVKKRTQEVFEEKNIGWILSKYILCVYMEFSKNE